MEYRRLGRTGLRVSALCLGAWKFGTKPGEAESREIIARALDAGINFVDTANVYGKGMSEEIVGKAIGPVRDRVVLATKVRGRMHDDTNGEGLSRFAILRECEESLRRLGTEYIDLYQVHWFDPATPLAETLEALNDLVRQGKVRYLGCSNFAAWQLCKALWISDVRGWARFDSVQPYYNAVGRDVEKELVPLCEAEGVGIIPYSPLAGGFLTGKYRRGEAAPEGSRYAEGGNLAGLATEASFGTLERLEAVGKRHGKSVGQAALAWLLRKPVVSAAIIGASSVVQLQENLGAADWRLTEEEVQEVG
jgi:aryl-alcohol dehydrogenase-like predicted oxidoreductase